MVYSKVIYVVKETLHMYPPCITQIMLINECGIDVEVICGECDINLIKMLEDNNISCQVLGSKRIKFKLVGKIVSYLVFRYKAWKLIKKSLGVNSLIWFGTADGAIALAGKYKNLPYILSVLELYDTYPFYRNGLKNIIGDALSVIACEDTRASIMKIWYKLKSKPFVMPNKPFFHPRIMNQESEIKEVKDAILKIRGKNIILYQGIISADRDLCTLADALNYMQSNYTLVLIGKPFYDGVETLKGIYKNTLYLGSFPAPTHLNITSYARIGIANYDDSSMNNLFCAPNKIFEYSGFGIPVLGSDVPGMVNTIGTYSAGECVDFSNRDAIVNAIKRIEDNYATYSINARKFYDSVDNISTMIKIFEKINS